jgi:Holliday junction resolvasome RuvABC endonuclease subunit
MIGFDKIIKGDRGEIWIDGEKLLDLKPVETIEIGGSWAARGYRLFLGLDTSLTKSGWAVVGVRFDGSVRLIDYGLIKTNAKQSDGERLRAIVDGVRAIIDRYPELQTTIPREAGIVRFNLPTKQIFKAHGATEYAIADYKIHDVNIQSVKAWARRVTGSPGKRNDKDMIAEAVRLYFNDPDMKLNKEGDEADAIAVTLFYLSSEGLI